MKKIAVSLFLATFFFAGTAFAQTGMMGGVRSGTGTAVPATNTDTGSAVQDILSSQGVSEVASVDCAKVTDDQFEKLGDAYMGLIHPGSQHDIVEKMMGGEGSATLKQAHITMGRSYIGCWSGYSAAPYFMPMMGYYGATSSATPYGFGGMMGGFWGSDGYYSGFHWLGLITMLLVWTLLILAIIVLVRWMQKKK